MEKETDTPMKTPIKTTSMETLLRGIDSEKKERFNKSWSKLDKGSKLNRIHLFIRSEKETKDLTEKQVKQLKLLLLRIFESGNLNKVSEINYSSETFEIESIKNLTYDKQSKQYEYIVQQKKKKNNNKSKTNVERHFSRSKETKR
tara:strand:+ start:838 stop:1272 length:435 start_codon:yes stop_codon:yes gene_type:complete